MAQQRLHEIGQGPPPVEPPLPPASRQLRIMTPVVKARMRRPEVYRNGGLTLTFDGQVGFVLEDAENSRNATIHAGGPFKTSHIMEDQDLLDLIGLVKLLLRMIDAEDTRDVAVLAYYVNRPVFSYQVCFERGKQIESDADGQFVVTETPRFFKLRIDSDLSTPYGDPMQGTLIYLNQHSQPGILISTLGLLDTEIH